MPAPEIERPKATLATREMSLPCDIRRTDSCVKRVPRAAEPTRAPEPGVSHAPSMGCQSGGHGRGEQRELYHQRLVWLESRARVSAIGASPLESRRLPGRRGSPCGASRWASSCRGGTWGVASGRCAATGMRRSRSTCAGGAGVRRVQASARWCVVLAQWESRLFSSLERPLVTRSRRGPSRSGSVG